jgi:hypothetical protein
MESNNCQIIIMIMLLLLFIASQIDSACTINAPHVSTLLIVRDREMDIENVTDGT